MNRPRARKLRLPVILAIVFFALIIVIGSLALVFRSATPKTEYVRINTPAEEDLLDADFENQGKWYGLCGKNSIHSIDDFQRTVSEDQALKSHYAGFNWEKASLGNLQKPMLAYVYFKKDGKIFPSKNLLNCLPAMDTLRTAIERSEHIAAMTIRRVHPLQGPRTWELVP